jgi:ecotropic viral integration site 5 protein
LVSPPQYFQKELPHIVENDADTMFNLAFSMKINTKKMKKMEKEYADLRKKEQEEMVELRVSAECNND